MERAKPPGKLLKKPAEHEEERLARLDFVFEFKYFLERFAERHELEEPGCFSRGAFPKLQTNRPEPRRNRLFLEGRELAQRVNSPTMENIEDAADLGRAFLCRLRC